MAIIGHGSTLTILGPTGTSTINATLACLSIDFGSNKVDAIDTTDMATPGIARTKTGGLENSGDVSIKFNVKPGDAGQQALATAKGAGLYDFKVAYPGGVRARTFTALVISLDESIPDDKAATKTAKLEVSGTISDQEGTGTGGSTIAN